MDKRHSTWGVVIITTLIIAAITVAVAMMKLPSDKIVKGAVMEANSGATVLSDPMPYNEIKQVTVICYQGSVQFVLTEKTYYGGINIRNIPIPAHKDTACGDYLNNLTLSKNAAERVGSFIANLANMDVKEISVEEVDKIFTGRY